MQLETVGEIVRILRSRLSLEQVELARSCGWRDASAVSRIETDRIHPTKRTLTKLADALARPGTTGSAEEIRSYLFRAAGVLPTAAEVDALAEALPPIDGWGQPAMIMDFGWHLWRANALASKMLSIPDRHRGRNYLELLFDPDGRMRSELGQRWPNVACVTLMSFRETTDRKADQRWRRKLMTRLDGLPDFTRTWREAGERIGGDRVHHRRTSTTEDGTVGFLHLTLTADPRLQLTHVVPEDAQMTRALLSRGLMLS